MAQLMSQRVARSQLWRKGIELQDQTLYSLITLPAAINPAGGILFFGDTESTVGRQRTNMTRANEVPGKTNFEVYGIGVHFLAPLTVVFADVVTAIRDAFMNILVNNSERRVYHLTEFQPSMTINPSFSAAAGDNPVLTSQGTTFYVPVDPTIVLQGGVSVSARIFFVTNVANLGNTVMGIYFNGLIDRGDIKLDQTPYSNVAVAAV